MDSKNGMRPSNRVNLFFFFIAFLTSYHYMLIEQSGAVKRYCGRHKETHEPYCASLAVFAAHSLT